MLLEVGGRPDGIEIGCTAFHGVLISSKISAMQKTLRWL
jgi:hypothetical protein